MKKLIIISVLLFYCSSAYALQIVTIDTGTKKPDNNLGDIVSIRNDNIPLTGNGYANFKIIRIKGYTKAKFKSFMPAVVGTEKARLLYNLFVTTQESSDLNSNNTVKQGQILTNKLKKND